MEMAGFRNSYFNCASLSYDDGDCLSENCTNGSDDDNDGDVDCDDSECSNHSSCTTPSSETNCTNGIDDDSDGDTDCDDSDCSNHSSCQTSGTPADLVISALSCTNSAAQGDSISCSYTISNSGGTNAGSSVLRLFLSPMPPL